MSLTGVEKKGIPVVSAFSRIKETSDALLAGDAEMIWRKANCLCVMKEAKDGF